MKTDRRLGLIIIVIILSIPAKTQSLQDILEKNNEALGIKNRSGIIHMQTKGYAQVNGSEAKIPFKIIQSKPDMMRIETLIFGFKAIQTYDGTEAWSLSPTQGMQAVKSDTRDMEFIAAATAIDGPFSVNKNNKYLLTYDGKHKYLEKEYHTLLWSSPEERLKYYINTNNWLVDGLRYEYKKNGGWYSMEYRIKNYENIDGSIFPSEITALINGVEMLFINIDEIKVLPEIDVKEFSKPSY